MARSLATAACAFVRAQGLKHILVGVVAGNAVADGLYAVFGFKPYSLERLKKLD
jgi:hypothetical protein